MRGFELLLWLRLSVSNSEVPVATYYTCFLVFRLCLYVPRVRDILYGTLLYPVGTLMIVCTC